MSNISDDHRVRACPPEYIAHTERIAGKPFGEMTTEDRIAVVAVAPAEQATWHGAVKQADHARATITEIADRYGAGPHDDLLELVEPGSAEHDALLAAIGQVEAITELCLDEDDR